MLIIRQAQFEGLSILTRAKFLDEFTIILHKAQGELGKVDSLVPTAKDRQEVEVLARKAESFGLLSNESISIFLQTAFFIGSDFHEVFIPAGEVLRSQLLDENTKKNWLEQWYWSLLRSSNATID